VAKAEGKLKEEKKSAAAKASTSAKAAADHRYNGAGKSADKAKAKK
ncbi:hypothetical protein HY768_05565, partial [candidate division TA06 bacterium]|nr:hypothetical protein [candidate division TA06 bacterium]